MHGTLKFKIFLEHGIYTGEINEQGKAYGEGAWTDGEGITYTGLFRDNKPDTYSKSQLSV